MKWRRLAIIVVCLSIAVMTLCACGAVSEKNSESAAPAGTQLSADEAYETAMSASEDEQCTDDECVVVLYDDDGDCPYNILSPVGKIAVG